MVITALGRDPRGAAGGATIAYNVATGVAACQLDDSSGSSILLPSCLVEETFVLVLRDDKVDKCT